VDESVPGSANLVAGPSGPALFLSEDDLEQAGSAAVWPLRKEKFANCEEFDFRALDHQLEVP
jgi:hypothetical protein